ncbi:stem-specific TSJT1-like [Olea europaea subsp. europaea]|uniref:Stem-specific TSJT1-like n=1 Tax=Olea europaea subsp. europaea TaxID=158383 RepID=A0A8S0Q8V0_OLEEU|nr:stem-specific TSJT1-like [Olea europaea subsp. europaea]
MLAIFKKGLVNPPQELNGPVSPQAAVSPKKSEEILKGFLSDAFNGFSIGFGDKALLAYTPLEPSFKAHQRLFCGVNDMYCIFLGSLNLCTLNRQYGLSKGSNEAMFLIEAYRTLRDRGPYPAHEVLKDLEGSFGFVIYDHKAETVFTALGADDALKLYWGIAADGSVIISDNVDLVKASCRKSFAPFPPGMLNLVYHS